MSNPPHASEVNFITNEDLDGLLTNNLESERHLAGFRKQVAVAKFRNQRLTAKGIRNECTLLKYDSFKLNMKKKVVRLLNEMDQRRVEE